MLKKLLAIKALFSKRFRQTFCALTVLIMAPQAMAQDIQITEIWSGNVEGANLTADWFEIKNLGTSIWTAGSNPLYYDDDSADPLAADEILGITTLGAGEVAIVVVGTSEDSLEFATFWSSEMDITTFQIGYTDGSGLSGGGDAVTLWIGEPSDENTPADFEEYPNPEPYHGASYDVQLKAFSSVGNNSEAVKTTQMNNLDEAVIASPGFAAPAVLSADDFQITEIWSGNNEGDNLTQDWFEIINTGDEAWRASEHPMFYYDDESADESTADVISGIEVIPAGGVAIVLVTDDGATAMAEFSGVWETFVDLEGMTIGYTDGAGLGSGGDAVSLWLGEPNGTGELIDYKGYPNTEGNGGKSFDVRLQAFSEVGNSASAVASGANNEGEVAIASIGATSSFGFSKIIPNMVVPSGGSIDLNLSSYFLDPENELEYTVEGLRGEALPDGVSITGSVLSGTPTEPGYYTLKAIASTIEPSSVAPIESPAFGIAVQFPQEELMKQVGTITLGSFGGGAAEISAFDTLTNKLFVTNAETQQVDVVDLSDPGLLRKTASIDLSTYGDGATSVAVANGIFVAAVPAIVSQDNGTVVAFDVEGDFSTPLWTVTVGALPDMVTFNNDGTKVLIANEGEPSGDYTNDPEGSISIIDVATQAVTHANFNAFNGMEDDLALEGIRIFGPNASVSQDLEPEYIAVVGDTAYVSCQENNAIAIVRISTSEVVDLMGLGYKDHSLEGNGLDVPYDEKTIYITNMPFKGMYMPDAISAFRKDGVHYILTANEGDAREYDAFEEESEIGELPLDPATFANIEEIEMYGNGLGVSLYPADTTEDGDYTSIYSFGARSFSIYTADGSQIFDSGDDFEQITATMFPKYFNSTDDEYELKNRSDNKGPEPEAITYGMVGDKMYAFIGLERMGGIMVYDITDPANPTFVQYLNNRKFDVAIEAPNSGDDAPEGLLFISAEHSPNGQNLLVVSHEVSGTVTVFQVGEETPDVVNNNFRLQLLHYADVDGNEQTALDAVDEFSALVRGFQSSTSFPNTLTVTSGDIMIPGPRFYAAEQSTVRNVTGSNEPGHADIAFANAFGVDASVIGNHDLDQGTGEFFDAAFAPEGGFPASLFPWLGANVDFSEDEDLSNVIGEDGNTTEELKAKVAKYAIKEINGEQIGIVGASGPMFPSITNTSGLTITPGVNFTNTQLAEVIQPSIDSLIKAGVNKIVLISHMQQISIEKELATLLNGVDIIVAGGSNTRMGNGSELYTSDDAFAEGYPYLTKNADNDNVAVVNVDGDFKYLGRLVVEFDENGKLVSESIKDFESNAFAATESVASSYGFNPIEEVVDIRDALNSVIEDQFGNIIGYSSVYLDGRRSQVRSQETNLGNLSADANLWYANELNPSEDAPVVISLKNGGGIRTEIGSAVAPAGSSDPSEIVFSAPENNGISEGHLRATFRFDNGLVRLTVTATELKALMEHAFAGSAEGNTPGQFPQVAGMQVVYDLSKDARAVDGEGTVTNEGSRVINLIVGEGDDKQVVIANGEIVGNASRTFNMVTLNFLANGGDSYPFDMLSNPNRINYYLNAGFGEEMDYPDGNLAADPAGNSSFSYTGGEQDALAEYLLLKHPETNPFAEEETEDDSRILRYENIKFAISVEIAGETEISTDGGTVNLIATVGPETAEDKSVTWSFVGDSLGASISNAGVLTASGEEDGNGVLTVVAVANGGFMVSDTVQITISEQKAALSTFDNALTVYPNPSNGFYQFSQEISGKVFSLEGLRITEFRNSKTVDISGQPAGIYIMVLEDNARYKLIIE